MTRIRLPVTRLAPYEVFAVDATTVQLSVRGVAGPVRLRVGNTTVEEAVDRGALFTFDGLHPDTTYDAELSTVTDTQRLRFRTRPPIGPVQARIATISDVHLGLEDFGLIRKIRDDGDEPFPLRCARAAIREAEAWGADLLIVKGDLCETGSACEWDLAAELFGPVTTPVLAIPGNHEVSRRRELSPADGLARAGIATAPVQVRDLGGIRVIAADTSVDRRGSGRLDHLSDELVELARSSDRPVLLAIHHNIERLPAPWFWPPGIRRRNAGPVLAELSRTATPILVTSGHTHRNRRHWLGAGRNILFTEVGSTSDYPGVWAGYEVGTSAIRQTVRRIADPEARRWTDRTTRAVGGIWPRWSQGRLDDRCVDLHLR